MAPPEPGIQVLAHPTKGRALHVTGAFAAGQPIHAFTPLLLLPSLAHAASVCAYCLRAGDPRACSRCRASYYCDAACQGADWAAGHGVECKALRKAVGKGALPTPVRALVRLLLDGGAAEAVVALEGHGRERQDVRTLAMGACSFLGKEAGQGELQRAVDLLCKIQTNAFHRYDVDLGQVGIFLEPTLAMANHSCIPNALVQFMGRKAILRAEMPIKAGDEIEISYTDYTHPLSKRKEALSSYNFECQCLRCKDDMSIYQVCAASPNVSLNRLSLVSDISKLQGHPAVRDSRIRSSAKEHGAAAAARVDASQSMPESLGERKGVLQGQYRACRRLVADELWAVAPLPQVLTEISIYYAEDGNFPLALSMACFVATMCDPYRYAAPFHPVRIKGVFMIAKLLANTAADTAASSTSVTSASARANLNHKAQDALQDIDQVSLCQMLLIMILRWVPGGLTADWELSASAQEMLDDIDQLPGREKELSLINGWRQKPNDDRSRAFFEYAVLQQIDALASFAPAALKLDFE